jgi:outer membrane receptor for ferric coprogen and ferric-rhodotorulic acid
LNSGTAVNITFAKSTDPAIYKEYSGDPDASMVDAKLSGRYIVVGAEHQFINGSYLSKVTVNKDSL